MRAAHALFAPRQGIRKLVRALHANREAQLQHVQLRLAAAAAVSASALGSSDAAQAETTHHTLPTTLAASEEQPTLRTPPPPSPSATVASGISGGATASVTELPAAAAATPPAAAPLGSSAQGEASAAAPPAASPATSCTAPPAAAAAAAATPNIRWVFAETADADEDPSTSLNVPSNDVLSGITVAVTDALDVTGMSSRFGLGSSVVRHMARADSEYPFVTWMRTHGAHIVGKLECQSPLSLDEASIISPQHCAAQAVVSGSCDIAITSSIIGPAGLTSCVFHDVCAFKPTARTFPAAGAPRGAACPFVTESQSTALVGRHFDDLLYVWQAYTGEFKASMIAAGGGGGGGGGRPATGAASGSGADAALLPKAHPSASSTDYTTTAASVAASYDSAAAADGSTSSLWRLFQRSRSLSRSQGSSKRSAASSHAIDLTVGFPAKWIDKLMGDRLTSSAFVYQLHQMRELHRPMFRKYDAASSSSSASAAASAHGSFSKLHIRPIEFDSIDLELVQRNVQAIAQYELASAFDAHMAAYAHRGLLGGAAAVPYSSSSAGFLNDLPVHVASTIFEGRRLTSWDYSRALKGRERIAAYIEELFRDVDMICSPIVIHPLQDMSRGTPGGTTSSHAIAMSLPFGMVGSPTASAYLSDELSVQLVGELGRDSGLLDDATAFLSVVKGSSPGWFRRKFLNEQ